MIKVSESVVWWTAEVAGGRVVTGEGSSGSPHVAAVMM